MDQIAMELQWLYFANWLREVQRASRTFFENLTGLHRLLKTNVENSPSFFKVSGFP